MVKFQPLKHSCDIMVLPFALWLAYYFPTAVILTSHQPPVSRDMGAANEIGKDTPPFSSLIFSFTIKHLVV